MIMAHEGTLDKFIGDCVMAFWNAPLAQSDHHDRAVAAAIALQQHVPAINARLAEEIGDAWDGGGIAIGVGVASGTVVVGNFGSRTRLSYSVVGDTVNLAARLEPFSKQTGLPLTFANATAQGASSHSLLKIDEITVRGRANAEPIYSWQPLSPRRIQRMTGFSKGYWQRPLCAAASRFRRHWKNLPRWMAIRRGSPTITGAGSRRSSRRPGNFRQARTGSGRCRPRPPPVVAATRSASRGARQRDELFIRQHHRTVELAGAVKGHRLAAPVKHDGVRARRQLDLAADQHRFDPAPDKGDEVFTTNGGGGIGEEYLRSSFLNRAGFETYCNAPVSIRAVICRLSVL